MAFPNSVGSRGSAEWMKSWVICIVDMGMAMTKIKALDPQEIGKTFPIQVRFETSKAFYFEYLLMIVVFTDDWRVRTKTSNHSFLLDVYSQKCRSTETPQEASWLLPHALHSKHAETGLVVQEIRTHQWRPPIWPRCFVLCDCCFLGVCSVLSSFPHGPSQATISSPHIISDFRTGQSPRGGAWFLNPKAHYHLSIHS